MKALICLTAALTITGCSLTDSALNFGATYAERQAGYSYIPVEPSSVSINCIWLEGDGNNCTNVSKKSLLDALPDNSVRIATRHVSGSLSSGLVGNTLGVAGNTYEVIIDFVNTQTVNKQFVGKWKVNVQEHVKNLNRCYPMEKSVLAMTPTDQFENWTLLAEPLLIEEYANAAYDKARDDFEVRQRGLFQKTNIKFSCPSDMSKEDKPYSYDDIYIQADRFNIPVYYGIGLRLKANVTVKKGEVNLSSLPSLTAAVEANQATGTMSVQTIGISGKAARSNLLLLDKIDATTIQNAIQVLASIKASIESGDTTITPRIVGFHNTIGAGAQGVNLIHSLLAGGDHELVIEKDGYANGGIDDDQKTGVQEEAK